MVNAKQEFIEKIAAFAIAAYEKYQIVPSLAAAMRIIGARTCVATCYIKVRSRENTDPVKPQLIIDWRYHKIFAASAGLGM